jgi:dipeptidyl aminopeptidase/acylaminoacyl peptidase
MAGAAVVDTISQYALSDINHGVAAAWEFRGNPWLQPEQFDRANPLRFLKDARTPTLIVHGQVDDRVPFSQGQILYRALRDVGCEVEFLAFPREPHGFQEPAHAVELLRAWADWYARFDR